MLGTVNQWNTIDFYFDSRKIHQTWKLIQNWDYWSVMLAQPSIWWVDVIDGETAGRARSLHFTPKKAILHDTNQINQLWKFPSRLEFLARDLGATLIINCLAEKKRCFVRWTFSNSKSSDSRNFVLLFILKSITVIVIPSTQLNLELNLTIIIYFSIWYECYMIQMRKINDDAFSWLYQESCCSF